MLNNWINPVLATPYLSKLIEQKFNSFVFPDQLHRDDHSFQVALIGAEGHTATIRDAFYRLNFSSLNCTFTDLGDARNNDPSFMTAAYTELVEQNIFPIVLDPSSNTSLAIANSLKGLDLDNDLGVISPNTAVNSPTHKLLCSILDGDKVNLISLVAYQKHFANPTRQELPRLDYSAMLSLGKLRDDFTEVEPILRSLSSLMFDVKSIRASDSIGIKNQYNIGLFIEEACKLLQYACASNKLRALHITGYDLLDDTKSGAELIAYLIWYCLNGRAKALVDPTAKDQMTSFIVDLTNLNEQLKFWKNETNLQWWVEIPSGGSKLNLVPCSEKEYSLATENIISDRLFHLLGRS